MFFTIFKFELKYWLKKRSFYACISVIFLFALFTMAGASGAFGEGSASSVNRANAPLSIYGFNNFFNKILLLFLPAIIGNTLYKDFKNNFNSILYTYPFTKKDYLFAKFISSFLIVSLIAFSVEVGLIIGTKLPTINPTQLLPFDPKPYLQSYFIFLIPNLFIFSVLVFSVVLLTRNIYTGFISIIIFWLLKEIALTLTNTNSESFGVMLIDPFAENAIQNLTKYWTIPEKNIRALPSLSVIFANRLVWVLISVLACIATYRWFSFSQNPLSFTLIKKKGASQTKDNFGSISKISLPKTTFNFSFLHQLKTSWKLSQTDFKFIIKSGGFISIVIIGMLFIAAILWQINPQSVAKTLPVTWVILGFPVFFFSFLILVLTFLYAGILVNRANHSRFSDLIYASAVPNWVLLFSRFIALVKMQILLLTLILITGILVQISSGYYHLELGHYLFDLFGIHLIGFVSWAFASLWMQTLVRNTYSGLFLLVLGTLAISQLPEVDIEKFVFRFNDSPNADFFLRYSDMSGYGTALQPFLLYKMYWFLWGGLLFFISLLLFQRKITFSIVERLNVAKNRFNRKWALLFLVLIVGIFSAGTYLFNQEIKPENTLLSPRDENELLKQFQQKYGKYEKIKQPRILSLQVKLDMYPNTNSFLANGKYILINKTNQPIDTLLIKTGYDEITTLAFTTKAHLINEDKLFKFYIYKLENAIGPNDSITMNFTIKNIENSFLVQHSNILKNGTYLKSDIFPRLGYFANTEKTIPSDSVSFTNHYQSIDSDLINFEAIISTTPKQVAITSGDLINEWVFEGRRYFHYKSTIPIKFVFGFNSGQYAIRKENYKGVDLRVYFHPQHIYNINQMMEGLKASLDYNTYFFGPYQHKQAQIIEFARSQGSYATTAGNCIQISEIRFINDTSKLESGAIDLSFYVAAHELAHQWWGNQVIPANALGATMITESVAEYITAKIYEKKYGKNRALQFLKLQRTRYLTGRSEDANEESPLYLVNQEQPHIAYGKGAIALYTLSEWIGEEKLNKALREYLETVKNRNASYTTSLEMLDFLEKATPDSLQYLIQDMFKIANPEKTLQHVNKVIQ